MSLVCFISGSSRGIGLAIAENLAKQGHQVILNSRKEISQEVLDLFKDYDLPVGQAIGDISDFDQAKVMMDQILKDYGRIDVLVNNAGITRDGLAMRMKEEDFDAVINTNLKGAFNLIRHSAKAMVKQRTGTIINISSVEGLRALPGGAAYESTKFAVRGMTKSAAIDLAQYNILVNSVHPGAILTPMLKEQLAEGDQEAFYAGVPLSRGGEPVEYAKTIAFLASDESSYATGAEFVLDGGMTALL